MAGWNHESGLLWAELFQRRDEGCEIPTALEQAIIKLDCADSCWNEEASAPLWEWLASLTPDPELAASEPNELDAIRALRPPSPVLPGFNPTVEFLQDRMHGAWLLRATGCALGKPVECEQFGFAVEGGVAVGHLRIRKYLEDRGEWPLRDFFSKESNSQSLVIKKCFHSTREHIAFMEPDDDMHYPLIALKVLEQYGAAFNWIDVARSWTDSLPFGAICTAETQAILNFWNRSIRWGTPEEPNTSATPQFTRIHKNPYREWIGAQIRCDGWAWACAGNPERAAEFAYRDACWTHTRNGIYGAMFFAAMQSASFIEADPLRLVEIGLGQIPQNCRLAHWIRNAVLCAGQSDNFWDASLRLNSLKGFSTMDPVHTLNNAAICVLALLLSNMDPEESICNAVMGGLDTDCNGATVGSILGGAVGMEQYRGSMAHRLNDRMQPLVFGFTEISFSELASRYSDLWFKLNS